MANTIKVDIFARETIKPCHATPSNLRTFNLSHCDQLCTPLHIPFLFFYLHDQGHGLVGTTQRSQILKLSLAKTLTKYYHFAGRIKDHKSIECTDEGVDFSEAKVDYCLSNLLKKPDLELIKELVPQSSPGSLLLVQANFFKCGAMAVGISMSHTVADPAGMSTFIKVWAATALESGEAIVTPDLFIGSTLFPPKDHKVQYLDLIQVKCSHTRLVFTSSSINTLKAKAKSTMVQDPSRVEVVTALIWKHFILSSRSIKGASRVSIFNQSVNLRSAFSEPLSEYAVGNLGGLFTAVVMETDEVELQNLVFRLRNGKNDFNPNLGIEKTIEELRKVFFSSEANDVDMIICSNWCKMPFYEADFGWGKPIWFTNITLMVPNCISLSVTNDGDGIEAWIHLSEQDDGILEGLETNEELLSFALVNPSVCV